MSRSSATIQDLPTSRSLLKTERWISIFSPSGVLLPHTKGRASTAILQDRWPTSSALFGRSVCFKHTARFHTSIPNFHTSVARNSSFFATIASTCWRKLSSFLSRASASASPRAWRSRRSRIASPASMSCLATPIACRPRFGFSKTLLDRGGPSAAGERSIASSPAAFPAPLSSLDLLLV